MQLGSPCRSASDPARPPASAHPLVAALALGRPLVMGVLNVTPDSFSDGGQFLAERTAIEHAGRMLADGADIIDVGGESTRPYGSVPVSGEEEWKRLAGVVPAVVAFADAISIDTMKAATAAKALECGASIVNDVWGLQRDPDMARVVSEHAAGIIVMHNRERADPAIDILAEVEAFFARSLELAGRAGIAGDRIVLDPGIGFGKTPQQSIAVLAHLGRFRSFGLPLLIGLSRKRFIASISPSEPHQRLGGSIAANVVAVLAGAAIVRVHDVAETVQALRVTAAIREA